MEPLDYVPPWADNQPYDRRVAGTLTLVMCIFLALRCSWSAERQKQTFEMNRLASITISVSVCLAFWLVCYALMENASAHEGPPDTLHTVAVTGYFVVAAVSVVMMLLAVGRCGAYVLYGTLSVNMIAGSGYAFLMLWDPPHRVDLWGAPFNAIRFATWFHSMPNMCVLCAHASTTSVGQMLDTILLSFFCIFFGWAGADGTLVPALFPAGASRLRVQAAAALLFAASTASLAVLTWVLFTRLVIAAPGPRSTGRWSALYVSDTLNRPDQERAIRHLAMMIVASWWTFPVVFAMNAAGLERVAEGAFVALELVAKVLCTLVMMHGRIETLQERERRAREIEHVRLAEQLRAESMFVSYVFHEMRNPYNGIAGHLSCIDDAVAAAMRLAPRAPNPLALCLQNIAADVGAASLCSQHMSDVLNNVLDLRRIEEAAMTLESKPLDVCDLVHDVGRMIRPQDSVNVATRCYDAATDATLRSLVVAGDAVRLRQVVLNLLSNACKHTREGSIEILCGLVSKESDGRTPGSRRAARAAAERSARGEPSVALSVQVRDSGCGIDPEHQRTVFSKYVTLAADAPPQDPLAPGARVQSTGLGLVVAKRLVDLMGGSLQLTSPWRAGARRRLGRGAGEAAAAGHPGSNFHFDIVLPTAPRDAAVSLRVDHVPEEHIAATLPERLRCLVADDLVFNRSLLTRYLTRMAPFAELRWAVEECTTGEDVLSRVLDHREQYDILFIDEHFDTAGGVLRGSQVLRRLRDALGDTCPVLITTSGNCLAEDVDYYAACGADETFGKPLPNKFDLGRRLLQILKRKHGDAFRPREGSPPFHDDKRARPEVPAPRPAPRRSSRKRSQPEEEGPTLRRRA